MYFVSRGGRLYAFCVQLSPWQRYALTASVLISIVLCWYYLVYLPLEDVVALYEHRRTSAQHTHSRACAVQPKLENQKKQLHRLQRQLQTMLVPYNTQEISPVSIIATYAHQAGLQLHACSSGGSQNKVWYTQTALLLDATGSLEQLIYFFDSLAHAQQIYGCATVSVHHIRERSQFHVRALFNEHMVTTQENPST